MSLWFPQRRNLRQGNKCKYLVWEAKARIRKSETEKEDIIKPVVAEGSYSLNFLEKSWTPAYNTHLRVISLEGLGEVGYLEARFGRVVGKG